MTEKQPLDNLLLAHAALTAANIGIGVSDAGGRFAQVNNAFCSLTGWHAEELAGMPIATIGITPGPPVKTARELANSYGGIGRDGEIQLKRQDGRSFWAHVSSRVVDTRDPAQGVVHVVSDITRRKRLEESLQRTLSEREVVLQSTLFGVTYSVDNRHYWVNSTFAHMLGYAPEELVGASSAIHFRDRQQFQAFTGAAHALLAAGKPYSAEIQLKRKDGVLIWCLAYGNAIDHADPTKATIWTFLDITKRKRAEEETRVALARERELNEMKTRFVSMASHEFRTPLATILSSVELIEQYSDRLPAQEKAEIIGSIKIAVQRMTGMLEHILLIGKADSGHLTFEPAPLNLRELCDRVIEEARTAASASHRFTFSCSGDCERAAMDERLVRHIVSNLLSNAVKYSPAGSEVAFALARRSDEAIITVADTGIGIPAADLPRLFESFHRGANVSNIQGTGLGLTIVKKAVDQHGGRIEIQSEINKGTRFTVTLPLTLPVSHAQG